MHEHRQFYKEVTHKVRSLRRDIGLRVHATRLQKGLTLDKLGRLSRLSPDVIDRLEIGKGEIDLIQIVRLAVALRSDERCLLNGCTRECCHTRDKEAQQL